MQYNLPKVQVVPDCDHGSEYGSSMGHDIYADEDDSAEGTEDGMDRSQYPVRSTASVTVPGRVAAGGSRYPGGYSSGSFAGSPSMLSRPPATTSRMAGGWGGGSITGVREREPLGEGNEMRVDSGVYASSKVVMEVS